MDKMDRTTEHLRQRFAQIALVEESATREYGLPYSNIYVTIPPLSPGSASIVFAKGPAAKVHSRALA